MNEQKQRKKIFNNKSKYIVLILLLLISIFSISYAALTIQLRGKKNYTLSIGTLDFSMDNEQNAIRLMNAYPMTDEEGQTLRPYTFTLTNTGTIKEYYKISLITDTESQANCSGCTFLSPNKLRYSLTVDGVVGKAGTVSDNTTLDSGELTVGASKNYELRLWLNKDATIEEENKYYYGKIKVDASQVEYETVTFAGITEKLDESTETMSTYSNQGCIANADFSGNVCIDGYVPMNGLYELEDDDGMSYYYKGEVDNLVKFGTYETDYYVYRYDNYDFVSLDACQFKYSNCSESNKVLKYSAGTPMYWKIIRINGDKTIRMIYAGTTATATGYDTGIGLSRYSELINNIKYSGYTYDRTTTEVASDAKKELDTWYNTYLAGTEYDSKIAIGKFCSDTSGVMDATIPLMGGAVKTFASVQRNFPMLLGLSDNATPTFKCPTTSETYGGSYLLKVGLITTDEMVAAGGQIAYNNSYYLYNGTEGSYDGKYSWTMSPTGFGSNYADVGIVHDGGNFNSYDVDYQYGLLRPVINLTSNVTFKRGTEGTSSKPYEVN